MNENRDKWLERTELLLGREKLERLRRSRVLVVGLGGVGAYAAEMIARAGVGHMTVADADVVSESNINRQLIALHSTVGRPKTEVMAERLRDINPASHRCRRRRIVRGTVKCVDHNTRIGGNRRHRTCHVETLH